VAQKGISFIDGYGSAGSFQAENISRHGGCRINKLYPSRFHRSVWLVKHLPFRKLIIGGLSSVMVAHLVSQAWHKRRVIHLSLSEQIIGDVLQEQLNFKGFSVYRSLNMAGSFPFLPRR